MFRRPIAYKFIAGFGALALAVLVFAMGTPTSTNAATAPTLGAAGSYAVIAGSTVTNTGPSTIEGDLGVSPGTAVTGFGPGIVSNGSIHAADAHAGLAQDAVATAYNALATQPCDFNLTGQDLGGQTLIPGVYCFDTSAQLTGLLTLDAQGSADAVFIFQIGSTLTTASVSVVDVINGGIDCNAFWQIGSSSTLGTGTVFVGNILALTSISLTTTASISGRAFARNGAVTLDTNHIGFEACTLATPTASPTATVAPTAVPTAVPTATPIGQTPTPIPTPTPVGTTPSPTPGGQTPAPTPTATPISPTQSPTPMTPTPSPTPVTQTPTPTGSPPPPPPTNSPSPTTTTVASVTPTPVGPTRTPNLPHLPPPGPTNTPVLPGFPNTGGPPTEDGVFSSSLLLFGLALSALGAATFVLSRRNRHAGVDA